MGFGRYTARFTGTAPPKYGPNASSWVGDQKKVVKEAPQATTRPDDEKVPIDGVMFAPEIYVDGYQGASFRNGVIKINFYTTTFDPVKDTAGRRATFTMVTPLVTMIQIRDALTVLIDALHKEGVFQIDQAGAEQKK